MKTARRCFWVLLVLPMPVAELGYAEIVNGTLSGSEGNDTSSALAELPQGNDNIEVSNKTTYTQVIDSKNRHYRRYGGGGGGRGGEGTGGGGGRGGGGGSYGWGWVGGGWHKWGCRGKGIGGRKGINNRVHKKRVFYSKDYKLGEFAQCLYREGAKAWDWTALVTAVDHASMIANICAKLTVDALDLRLQIPLIS